MGTAIARVDDLTPERVALLKRTLCNGLTDDEMELFAAVARRSGLDPFAKQIYATKRRDKRAGVDKLTIQTGIDGFRVIAVRTGELDGQDGPYWCGADGVWRDVWLANVPPAAAKVIVFRKGCSRGFAGIARFSEYAQAYPDGNLSGLWPKMGATMIAKCAEALALRKAFPQDLSGLYTSEEMEQADTPEPAKAAPVSPKPAAPVAIAPAPTQAPAIPAGFDHDKLMTETAELVRLAHLKGWDWVRVIQALNEKYRQSYSVMHTPWNDVMFEHRESVVAALVKMPDVKGEG